ncbi:MAG: DUF115 domain-containing protein [Treponema sp.]|nr:DUF115 domain-containing protein [Treponema sp.]
MIYKEIFTAKNGSLIPIFQNGKPTHSKYNPENEAKNIAEKITKGDFYIFLGIGAGFLLEETIKKFPDAKILAVEAEINDICFLKENFPLVKKLSENKNVIFTDKNHFSQELKKNYFPAIYSKLDFQLLPSWANENRDIVSEIYNDFQKCLEEIKRDFSVQAHFGKIWTKNILQNLMLCKKNVLFKNQKKQKAIVCAAGPSLEQNLEKIREESRDSYIIASDTAYKILLRKGISIDAVISVDGQMISSNHFTKNTDENPLFVFSLSGNHQIAKKLINKGKNVIFTLSNNPLEQLAYFASPSSFFYTDTSSGTVTVAAIDIAKNLSYSEIEVYGADFSYPNNKTYAKGSYLDDLYQFVQIKLQNFETSFSKLMYRTELVKNTEGYPTTETLDLYRKSLYLWAENNNYTIKHKQNTYYLIGKSQSAINTINLKAFNFTTFKKLLKNENDEKVKFSLLPLISNMKFNDIKRNNEKEFAHYQKLALNFILRYTKYYE